jgi:hypothetical protein
MKSGKNQLSFLQNSKKQNELSIKLFAKVELSENISCVGWAVPTTNVLSITATALSDAAAGRNLSSQWHARLRQPNLNDRRTPATGLCPRRKRQWRGWQLQLHRQRSQWRNRLSNRGPKHHTRQRCSSWIKRYSNHQRKHSPNCFCGNSTRQ